MIFIETVGAGQAEVDIARLTHTTLVVEAPGLGDDIQAIKAGILEIADILVLNKADRPGVENAETSLRNALRLANSTNHKVHHHYGDNQTFTPEESGIEKAAWQPPIIRTVAIDGSGIDTVAEQIEQHRIYLKASGEWEKREQQRLFSEVESLLQRTLMQRWRDEMPASQYEKILAQVTNREISTAYAVKLLINGGNQQ